MRANETEYSTSDNLQERYRVLQAVYDVTSAVSYARDVTEIYEIALRGLLEALRLDRVAILQREPDGTQHFEAWHGLSQEYRQAVASHSPWSADEPDPQPILVGNVAEDPRVEPYRDTILQEGIQALAFIPLLYQRELLGKFMLYYDEPHSFAEEEVELAYTIAGQVAQTVARRRSEQEVRASRDELEERVQQRTAQLQEQVLQREQAEQRLREESALVHLLQEIAAFANEADSFKKALRFTLARLCEYGSWPVGHAFRLHDEQKQLIFERIWCVKEEERFAAFRHATEKTVLTTKDDWIGQIFQSGKIGWLTDIAESPSTRRKAAINSGLRSCFALPVVVHSEVVAILEFFSSEPLQLNDTLLEAMEFVSSQLAHVVEREQAASALWESERRFRAIFNQTFQFIGLCKSDGTLMEANQAALDFGGVARDEVIGKRIWETYWWNNTPEEQEKLRAAMREATSGSFVRYEAEVRGIDNKTEIIDFSLKPVLDHNGEVVLIIPEGRIITELKQALDRLQRSETMLSEAQRLAHIGSWEWNAATDILVWSEELYHIFGVDREHVVPTFEGMAELIHPDDLESWVLRNRSAVEPLEGHVRIIRPDDQLRILHARTTPIFDADGRRIKLFGTIQDVTERRQTEEALRRSERLLAEAQRVAHLGSWEWDVVNDRITWSDQMYRIYGLQPGNFEPNYENYLQLVHPEDREFMDSVVKESLQTKEMFETYHRIVRSDGVLRILHARGRLLLNEKGELLRMYGTAEDVTEQKQIEEALRKSEESYRTLARNIPDAIVALYDQNLQLILLEGDVPSPVSTGMSLTALLPTEHIEDDLRRFREALQGTPQVFERENGDRVYLVQAVPVLDEDGEIFAGIAMVQDITVRNATERKLEQRAQQLAALHEMGQTVAGSLDLDVIFKRVLDNLRPLLNAEGVFILLHENERELVFAAANEVGVGNLTGQRVSANEGVAGLVLRTREVQWFHGEETRLRIYHELEDVAHYHPRAILAAPLKLHGELIGVMEAVHTRSDAFNEDDKPIIQTAANWTAIAIGNARQHGRLQRRLRESEALAAISRALSETLDLERILQLIVEAAQQLIPHVDSAVIHFLQSKAEQEHLYPVAIARVGINEESYFIQPGSGVEMDATLAQVQDLDEEALARLSHSTIISNSLKKELSSSLLVVPIESREDRLGVISVQSTLPNAFSDEDKELLTTLGRQAAVAIEKARLFEAQQQARQTADTLRAANVTLSQTLDLDTILDTLFAHARELIGFEQALVVLTQRGGYLQVRAHHGFNGQEIDVGQVPLFRRVLEEKTSIIKNDISEDTRLMTLFNNNESGGSCLAVPLITSDKVIGIFTLYHPIKNHYSERLETLAEALAAQASIAIQNARLFAQVQAGQGRLRLLSKQVVSAQEEERQRVSRELHDEAGQALTALKISLEMIRASWSDIPELILKQMNEAISMTDQTMEQIRLLAHDLRPPVLDTFGLETTLEGLVRDFGRRTNLEIEFKGMPIPKMPEAITVSFYRFVQEALTNIARHAGAKKVTVELHDDGDKIMVAVKDNGKGFHVDEKLNVEERKSGIGLMGMQDRFDLLNGWVKIESAPGQGTRVAAYVPYREEQ